MGRQKMDPEELEKARTRRKSSYLRTKTLATEKGYTIRKLSSETGIPTFSFSDWGQGRYEPGIRELAKIAGVLDVSPYDLVDGAAPVGHNNFISAIYPADIAQIIDRPGFYDLIRALGLLDEEQLRAVSALVSTMTAHKSEGHADVD